jgi:toxin ParE1/3/4
MSKRTLSRPKANRDLDEIAFFLSNYDESSGFRFLDAFDKTIGRVTKMPGIGRTVTCGPLPGLRRIPVIGYKKYLIFYLDADETIEVVRVLHSSRNIRTILENES